jgi:hypothetical protein
MTAPKRIQLRRTKGWRKPEGAIVISRPSKWGNPITVEHSDRVQWGHGFFVDDGVGVEFFDDVTTARAYAAEVFASDMRASRRLWMYPNSADIRAELAGHDLACWCPLDQPCHADVLLELANR